jgi:transcription antitermination factor NusG
MQWTLYSHRGWKLFTQESNVVARFGARKRNLLLRCSPATSLLNLIADLNRFSYSVRYVRGARRIVDVSDVATPIEKQVITSTKLRTEEEREHATMPKVKRGDSVVMNRGALFGLEEVFVEDLNDKERVMILLNAIEWQARVQVEKSAIEKLASYPN